MKKMSIIIVTILVMTVFTGVICYADVIYGCKQKKTGQLRIVDNSSQCQPNEVPISLSQGLSFYQKENKCRLNEGYTSPDLSCTVYCNPGDIALGGSCFPAFNLQTPGIPFLSNSSNLVVDCKLINPGPYEQCIPLPPEERLSGWWCDFWCDVEHNDCIASPVGQAPSEVHAKVTCVHTDK